MENNFKVIIKYVPKTENDDADILEEEFESYHDAYVWIKENHENIRAMTNPLYIDFNESMNSSTTETPTEERVERLTRYVNNVLSIHGGDDD